MKSIIAPCPWVVALVVAWQFPACQARADEPSAAEALEIAHVEFFEKKVRPLLVARCHECHATAKPKGGLRLDSRAGLLAGGDTGPAIVPGKPDESLLVDAIRYGDTYQMPPKSRLPEEEIATLVEWVRLGAPWGREIAGEPNSNPAGSARSEFNLAARAKHWSFQPMANVTPPNVNQADWIRTPVDRFILHKLESAGMAPAPAAERGALLRRVTYDLIGLPPTPAEIEAFAADGSQAAYEKVVDRLLASPQYGERWARHWLDLVRYAETYGHEFDYDMPNAYRYRDYVIRAMNDDLPYDRFVVEHVAGDLLDEPRLHPCDGTNESILATGFFLFGEAKHSPVDVQQDEADRIDNQIDVLAKTFLGLTVSCARCHDHKFDPISTKDYYALTGYLQSSRYQQAFIDPPKTWEKSEGALEEWCAARRDACLDFCRATIAPRLSALATAVAQKHVASNTERANDSASSDAIVFADFQSDSYGDWVATGSAFGSKPARPLDWSFERLEGLPSPGRLLGAAAAHSGLRSARFQGVLRSPTFEIPRSKIHYRLYGTGGQVRLIVDGLQLIKDPIYGGLQFGHGGNEPHWHTQDVSKWVGHRAYIEVIDDDHDSYIALEQIAFSDGIPSAPRSNRLLASINNKPAGDSPPSIAERYQKFVEQVFTAWVNHEKPSDADAIDQAAIINDLLAAVIVDRGAIERQLTELLQRLTELDRQQQQIEAGIAPPRKALAMADGTAENQRVFIRGSHKTQGDEVPRRFLEVLGGAAHSPPAHGSGRLELARQMVAGDNPLLSRVIVNRLWHHHFGAGIVRSVDDFGAMGQPPTHPELLDFLAAELMREGWSLKKIHRIMVLSNTYQMSSRPWQQADLADPENKLWHRMRMRRLEAECIRDAILAVSGRANPAMYGPSVMPHLTEFMTGRGKPADSGPLDGDGRRSIYLAVRRNFIAPIFLAFDYPLPFTTIGRRGASNVPAQALAMMNNPLVVEQAQRWATRVAAQVDRSPDERVREMYLTALGRTPDDAEMQAALAFVSTDEKQAWAELAHVLFNVKEFVFIP